MNTKLKRVIAPIPRQGKPVGYECLDCKKKFIDRKNLFLAIISSKPRCPNCGSKNVRKTDDLIVM